MNVLPLFYPRKTKNAVTCSVTTFREIFKVVPPGIEPGTQGFSVLCSTTMYLSKSYCFNNLFLSMVKTFWKTWTCFLG